MSSEESEKNNSKRKEPKEEETEDYDEKSEQIKEKAERAREKAERLKEKAKRINISVSPEMSEEWKDWSKELGSSVSELVRKSMKFMKNNIGDLSKLEAIGGTIERAVKESGLEDLGEKIEFM
jgi:ribosomal protein L9